MSKDRRGTGGGLTSEQFHDKFCDRTKDEDSLATKLAGWYFANFKWMLYFEAKEILERCLLVLYCRFLTVIVIWFHPNPILCPCLFYDTFIWLWTVIAWKKDQCHRLTLSQCRRRDPARPSARGRGCWAGPGRWCPSSPGCPPTGGGRTHSATSWPASPWPSCTYHR